MVKISGARAPRQEVLSFMTKIDIFSGFLGAGKTTLIKKLIAEAYTGEKIVLIENEFGEIAIDGGFLKDSGVQINEMNSGCICCSLVGDFADALKKVLEQFHPDRILIEPSGVGKLSDVIRAVQGVQSDELVLNGFTTVVDANKCKMYMKNFGEFFNNQVENASAIILSRTEGIRPEKLDAAVALLREKNPTATIVTTPWTELDGKQILETMERRDTLSAELEHLKAEAPRRTTRTSTSTITIITTTMTSTSTNAAAAIITMTTMRMTMTTNMSTSMNTSMNTSIIMTTMSTTMTTAAAMTMTTMTTITTSTTTTTAAATITITTTRTRCSRAGAPRRRANTPTTRSAPRSTRSSTSTATASCCAPRASCLRPTAAGSTLTTCPASPTSAAAAHRSQAACA